MPDHLTKEFPFSTQLLGHLAAQYLRAEGKLGDPDDYVYSIRQSAVDPETGELYHPFWIVGCKPLSNYTPVED